MEKAIEWGTSSGGQAAAVGDLVDVGHAQFGGECDHQAKRHAANYIESLHFQ